MTETIQRKKVRLRHLQHKYRHKVFANARWAFAIFDRHLQIFASFAALEATASIIKKNSK